MAATVAMGLAKMCCHWEKTRACPQPRLGVGRDAQGTASFSLPPPQFAVKPPMRSMAASFGVVVLDGDPGSVSNGVFLEGLFSLRSAPGVSWNDASKPESSHAPGIQLA